MQTFHFVQWRAIDRSRRVRLLALLVLLLGMLLLSACADPQMQAQLEQLVALNRTALEAQGIEPGNRLLIQGVDGNLYTMHPDGSAHQAITNDATSLRQYVQPTWSPTGERIAWTEINQRGLEPVSTLIVARYNGLQPIRYETPFAPFYIHWSPNGEWIAYLSNWRAIDEPSLALRVLDLQADPLGEESPFRTIVQGQPLYFSWGPESSRLLTHIANERIEFHTLEGEGESLALSPAQFSAPDWSRDGSRLLYADGSGSHQRLVLADADGNDLSTVPGQVQEVTDFDQRISFALNPTGECIAYIVSPQSVGTAAFGPLYVYELDGQRTRAIGNAPVLAFFWSPDGSKLAYLMLDQRGDSLQLRWHVWDGTSSQAYMPIVPTRTFLSDYLVFFDQYARSMTIWSPDSNAFTYAAVDPEAGSRVWVQKLDQAEPVDVGRGVFVAWSPR